MVFGRAFEGWSGSEASYFEINQEYSHVTGIHWRPEHRSYCRFDDNGDLEHVVSITHPVGLDKRTTCVSYAWVPLEQYLTARDATLVRRFDFTLLRTASFAKWPEGPEKVVNESDRFFYRQKVDPGITAYTTGVQLVSPRRPTHAIFAGLRGNQQEQKHVGFLAFDWRNRRVSKISTDPAATTNYFEAHKNALPFEMSPAFSSLR